MLNPPYSPGTTGTPSAGAYQDNPSHSLLHRDTYRFIVDATPVILPNSEAVIACQMFS